MSERRQPRALVVDDESDFAEFMAEVAGLAGFAALAISDAGRLVAALDPDPALIVLDLNMPEMDGIQVLGELARRGSRAELVLVSGADTSLLNATRNLAEAQGLRVLGVLGKPLRADELSAVLGLHGRDRAAPVKGSAGVSVDELRHAIERAEIVVHYQPQVALADGAWTGVEALARWQHPQRGLLQPAVFIPLAEESGLALPLTLRVLESAVADCVRISDEQGFAGKLSVNLPPAAMTDRSIPERFLSTWEKLKRRSGLQLEVTETSVPPDPVAALEILARLRLKGIHLSIDDFGTGHASLDQLRVLPFNELKIDMSFVRGARTDAKARMIAERSIQLGRDLGLTVLAEGVETEWHWHWLREADCELAQGYFVARPMPVEGFAAWRANWKAP